MNCKFLLNAGHNTYIYILYSLEGMGISKPHFFAVLNSETGYNFFSEFQNEM